MCGIAGIIGLEAGEKEIRPALERQLASLKHRGPDHQDLFCENKTGLAHARLSIIDLSPLAHQPMTDASRRYVMVFNGEVYNFEEVRKGLELESYRSQSDSEVVLQGFAEKGPAILDELNGMFALAIWDRKEKKLFLARDRMGIKPLYYHLQDQVLTFGSEVRSLLAAGTVPRKLNKSVLPEFLAFQTVHAPNTLVDHVFSLLPGEFAWFQNGKLEKTTWWSLEKNAGDSSGKDYATLKNEVRETFAAAVSRRMVADVPLGAFLSGGIDSSAVVAMMATQSSRPVETFSVVFDDKEFDESPWSEMMAKKYGTKHHPIKLKPEDFLKELPDALAHMDHPSGDGPNAYVVSRVTREAGVTVALSGLGGDELFAGYPIFKQYPQAASSATWKIPRFLRRIPASMTRLFPGGRRGEKLGQVLRSSSADLSLLHPVFRRIYDQDLTAAMIAGEAEKISAMEKQLLETEKAWKHLPGLSRISVAEISTYMQNVLLRDTDQMSMAHALEVRVPFLDHKLVELALGIPDQHKTPTIPKRLLVEALGDLLPDEIVHRKKMGFVFPWAKWLRVELAKYCGERMNRLSKRGIFDPKQLLLLWKDFLQNKDYLTWVHLWVLVVLDEWMEQNKIEA